MATVNRKKLSYIYFNLPELYWRGLEEGNVVQQVWIHVVSESSEVED